MREEAGAMMWQVIIKQTGQVVYMADTREEAEAKARRLNRMSPPNIKYIAEEVQDEQISQQKDDH